MSGRQVKSEFPRTIDKPMLFILWEIDEFMIFVVPLIMSIFAKEILIGMIIGIVLMGFYGKLKKNKPNNFLFHLFWKWGLIKVEKTPAPFIRTFLE